MAIALVGEGHEVAKLIIDLRSVDPNDAFSGMLLTMSYKESLRWLL